MEQRPIEVKDRVEGPGGSVRYVLNPVETTAAQEKADAGLEIQTAKHPWQGQVDIIPVERNRFVLTYGGSAQGSSHASVEEVKALLPMGAQVMAIELSSTCPRGSAAIGFLTPPGGRSVALVSRPALKSHSPEDLGRFIGDKVDVTILDAEDSAAFATEALNVRGTLHLPPGSSPCMLPVSTLGPTSSP